MDETEIALYKIFFDFIAQLGFDADLYMANSNAIAPSGPYMTFELIESQPTTWTKGNETFDDITGLFTTSALWSGIAEFKCFGDKSHATLQSLSMAFRERLTKQVLRDAGIGYYRSSKIRDASRAIDAEKVEKGASLQIGFYFVVESVDRAPAGITTIDDVTFREDRNLNYTNWPDGVDYEP